MFEVAISISDMKHSRSQITA